MAERTLTVTWQDPTELAGRAQAASGLDFLRGIISGELPAAPIQELLGFSLDEAEEGRVVFSLVPGEQHYNPIGSVHGGYAATLIDSAIGCAVHSTLPAGSGYSSLTLETKFVRPITRDTGKVRAEAQVLHRGRRQSTGEARLYDAATGKLLAHGTGTCLIFDAAVAAR